MNLILIKCPNCNSRLKCEDGLESYTCPYCESTFILNGQTKAAINAKARIKIEEKKLDNERYETDLEYKDRARKDEFELSKKKYEDRSSLLTIFVVILVVLISLSILFFIESKPSRDLDRLTANVQQYIAAHDFASARVEAQKIKYTESFFDFSEKAKWSSTKKALEKEIDKAEKEYKAEVKEAEKKAKQEAKEEAKAQKEAEKEAKKKSKNEKNFWGFLPWID